MILLDDPRIVIKLRLPDKKHRLSKRDGYRLIYLVYKDREEVALLDVYPKNGPMQQLDIADEEVVENQEATCLYIGTSILQESGGQELLYTIYSLTFAQTNRISWLRVA